MYKVNCQFLVVFLICCFSVSMLPVTDLKADSISNLRLNVQKNGWGEGRVKDKVKVFHSVGHQMFKHFENKPTLRIKIIPSNKNPRRFFKKSDAGEFQMRLTAKNRRWSQYSFQFAHELCHVLFDSSVIDKKNQNFWFEEALCELSSQFVLKSMATEWSVSPPYASWKGYAPALAKYSDDNLNEPGRNLPPHLSLAAWYQKYKSELAGDKKITVREELVAKQILPVFEKHPMLWESLQYLNFGSESDFGKILNNWRSSSPQHFRLGITEIIHLFGFRLEN